MLLAAIVGHVSTVTDWIQADTALSLALITVFGGIWRILHNMRKRTLEAAATDAKRDEQFSQLVSRFEREFGGNSGGLRQQLDENSGKLDALADLLSDHLANHSPTPVAPRRRKPAA